MKVLFIGDIVGKSGRDIVSSLLYDLKSQYNIDLVIANGENAAHGKGLTIKIYNQLLEYGIDYITMGNHTYSKREINDYMSEMDRLIVPYNHEKRISENFYKIIDINNIKICLCNILGMVFMNEVNMEPIPAFNEVLDFCERYNPDFYFVDFHGETTSEKRIFVEYFKDYAKVVVGTHTHVQTADEDIINGCAFISDVGMCGAYDSIIGRDVEETISSLVEKNHTRYTIATGEALFCAVIIEIDDNSKKPISIERIQIRP